MDLSLTEFMVVCGSVLLSIFLLTEILDWTQLFASASKEYTSPTISFGYGEHNGPHTWKVWYPESGGSNQSPINIVTRHAVVVGPSDPLLWHGYQTEPLSMIMANDGNAVVLAACWCCSKKPHIQGGALCGTYAFHSMSFHWGLSDYEGSEHTMDYVCYSMELQVTHVKHGFNSPFDAIILGAKDGVVVVSFFFQITNADNPYLDHVVTNLWRVARPGSKVHVPPFPLEWIFTPFESNYYAYNGSLTQPPCSEIVTWIVQPEPIAISANQVAQFRTVCSANGPLLSNCRPVQRINDRDIYFYA